MNESMLTMASKNSSANGSDRASAWIGNTPSSMPASRIRWMFSDALNHRSVDQTCTPNSRRRKIDDAARPQPRSSTRSPGRKSIAPASHSVSQSALVPPLEFATTHSGWYREARGNRSENSHWSVVTWIVFPKRLLNSSRTGQFEFSTMALLEAWHLLFFHFEPVKQNSVGQACGSAV